MRSATLGAALLLAGALTGWMLRGSPIATLDDDSSSRPRRSSVAASAGDESASLGRALEQIQARLASLEQRLAAPPAAAARAAVGAPTHAQLEALVARLEELGAALDEQRVVSETWSAAEEQSLDAIRAEHPAPKWDVLDELIYRWEFDGAGAQSEVMLFSRRELVRRFGTPTNFWGAGGDLNWFYQRDWDPSSESWGTEVYFRLVDGHVAHMNVARN